MNGSLPGGMGDFLPFNHTVLSDGVEFAEESVLRYHTPAVPCFLVFCEHVVDDVGPVPDIIVSSRDQLPRISVWGKSSSIFKGSLGIGCR